MANPVKWVGMKYPDSDLVSLLYRHARPSPANRGAAAVDVGCGAGRHLRVLEDLGYAAIGLDSDPTMCRQARQNGFSVEELDAREFRPGAPLALAVGWGFMMLLRDGPALLASWAPAIVVADWRSHGNSCLRWPGNQAQPDGAVLLRNPGHVLHEQTYYFHELDACQLPGYRRIAWQQVTKRSAEETNEWFQTVHVPAS